MKKLLITAISATALMGLAACSDTDDTTTQSVSPDTQQSAPATSPSATPSAPADSGGASTGTGTTGGAD